MAQKQQLPERPATDPNRVALYARVSREDGGRRLTVEGQINTLRTWVTNNGGEVVGEYRDDGVTGKTAFDKRKGGKQFIQDAKAGGVGTVAVVYIDRFGRTLYDGLGVAIALEEMGIGIISINEGYDSRDPNSKMNLQMRLMIAEHEWDRIVERTTAGKQRAMERDNAPPGGTIPFGYRSGPQGELVVYEPEAAVVRGVFERAAAGMTDAKITEWAAEQGIAPGRRSQKRDGGEAKVHSDHLNAKWHQTKIGKIRNNQVYIGIRHWGEREFPCPPLVTPELFARVQSMPTLHTGNRKRTDGSTGLLGGLLVCTRCGARYYHWTRRATGGKVYRYYCCKNRRDNNKCPVKLLPLETVDGWIWDDIADWIRNPDELLLRLAVQRDTARDESAAQEEEALGALAKVRQTIDDLVSMVRDGQFPVSYIQSQVAELDLERKLCEARLLGIRRDRARTEVVSEEQQALMERLLRVRAVLDLPEDEGGVTRAEKWQLVQDLVVGGTVETTGEGYHQQAEVTVTYRFPEMGSGGFLSTPGFQRSTISAIRVLTFPAPALAVAA